MTRRGRRCDGGGGIGGAGVAVPLTEVAGAFGACTLHLGKARDADRPRLDLLGDGGVFMESDKRQLCFFLV